MPWCLSARAAALLVRYLCRFEATIKVSAISTLTEKAEAVEHDGDLLSWLVILGDRHNAGGGDNHVLRTKGLHAPVPFVVSVKGSMAAEAMACLTELFTAFPEVNHCINFECGERPVVLLHGFWSTPRRMEFFCRAGHEWTAAFADLH